MQEIFFSPYNYVSIKKGFPNNLHFVFMLILTVKTVLVNIIGADTINEDFTLAQKNVAVLCFKTFHIST